ncbi:MAG TPA: dissimilatory-type sulfite reductase subunit beta, partial [Deltaproteobacteria bacterium]|nr:dissimilatory-type sulfite reductase subunit beta [Deltaproteobacteria bacterium]
MNAPIERTWKTVESGPHTLEGTLHPVVVKNYGKWKYHKMIKPGVMVHYGL